MKHLLFASLLVLSTASFGKTYDLSKRWGLGGGVGKAYPILDNDFDDGTDEESAWNLHYRYQMSDAKAWVLSFNRLEFADTTFGAKVYDLMYLVRTSPVDRLTPILGIGAGAADFVNTTESNKRTKFAGRARAGLEYAITEDLFASATVDYQYLNDLFEREDSRDIGEIHALTPQVNLTMFFGHDKEKFEKPARPAATTAAATPTPVASNTTIVNSTAPVAAAVDTGTGDDDQDGITNAKDKCPGTEAGKQVNAYGCVPEEKAQIKVEVFFDSGKATLDPNSHRSMEELAAFLKEHPTTRAEIQGHTDDTGSDVLNKKLSQRRADAVKTYLIEKLAVPSEKLTAIGYGEEKPIDDNTTPAGREKNRRVVAEITER